MQDTCFLPSFVVSQVHEAGQRIAQTPGNLKFRLIIPPDPEEMRGWLEIDTVVSSLFARIEYLDE